MTERARDVNMYLTAYCVSNPDRGCAVHTLTCEAETSLSGRTQRRMQSHSKSSALVKGCGMVVVSGLAES